MKTLLLLLFFFSFSLLATAQTFSLKFEEVTRNSTVFEVDVFISVTSPTFRLGSSNLQFEFFPTAIENPSLVTDSLSTSYDAVTVTAPVAGVASLNISLDAPGTGDAIAEKGVAWTNLARVRFDVSNSSGDFSLNWLYDGSSTQTVVFNDNESTQVFVADPNEDLINFNGTTLPVELIYFDAKWNNYELQRNAVLEWITATEQNSDFFRVQRSFDGSSWENIGRLAAAGTTIAQQEYTFTDASIGSNMPNDYVYYRLKQVDLDGSMGYSPVRVLERSGGNQQNFLTVRPNPVQDVLQVQGALSGSGTLQLRVVGIDGRVYREIIWEDGQTEERQLNIAELPAGIYFLHLENDSQSLQRKIIKQ